MSVLVTGIGFVGGYVVRDLINAGHEVVLFGLFGGSPDPDSDRPDLVNVRYLVGEEKWQDVRVVVGDIRDVDLLDKAITENGVTRIIHLASLISSSSEANIPRAVEVNVGGSVNIFEAGLRHDLERIVWSSSINVFGPKSASPEGLISDDSPLDPQTVYGGSKAFVERLGTRYHVNHGLNVVGLRLSKVYGFGEHVKAGRGGGNSWFSDLAERPAMGLGPCTVPFGDRSMHFQYIEDISAGLVTAVSTDAGAGQSFVTGGDCRPIRQAFDYVRSVLPDADMTLVDSAEVAGMHPGGQTNWKYDFDASLARDVLGIEFPTSVEDGLGRMISEYRRYADLPPVL